MSRTMKYIEYGFIFILFLFFLGFGSFFAYCAPFAAFQGQYLISFVLFFYSLLWFAVSYLTLLMATWHLPNTSQEVQIRVAVSDTVETVQEDYWMERYNEWVGRTRA